MDLGPVQVEPAFSNAFVLAARRDELKKSATAMINAWRSGTLIVVTHGANIQALSGHLLAPGEMIVVAPGSMPPRVIGRIPPPN